MRVLGIDPGKTTGYALIHVKDKTINPPTKPEDFGWDKGGTVDNVERIIEEGVDLVVMEDFKVRPDMAKKGHLNFDSMPAPQVIGVVRYLCSKYGVNLVLQPAAIKPVGYGFANMKYVKGKANMHWQDAYCHAVYYVVKNQLARPVKP